MHYFSRTRFLQMEFIIVAQSSRVGIVWRQDRLMENFVTQAEHQFNPLVLLAIILAIYNNQLDARFTIGEIWIIFLIFRLKRLRGRMRLRLSLLLKMANNNSKLKSIPQVIIINVIIIIIIIISII